MEAEVKKASQEGTKNTFKGKGKRAIAKPALSKYGNLKGRLPKSRRRRGFAQRQGLIGDRALLEK